MENRNEQSMAVVCQQIETLGNYRTADLPEYTPVIFAHDLNMAEQIRDALEERGIPTLMEFDRRISGAASLMLRVPVLVPVEMHDEASGIVARIEESLHLQGGFDEEEEEEVFDDDEDEDYDDEDDFEEEDDEDDFDDDEDF